MTKHPFLQSFSSPNPLRLYLVTDRHWLKADTFEQSAIALADQVEAAILGGVTFVQLREKEASYEEFLFLATTVKRVCAKHNVPFVINDNIQVAIAVGADGVHIGQDDEPAKTVKTMLPANAIVGVSAGTVQEAVQAQEDGADYIGVGAIFPTDSKSDANVLNPQELAKIIAAVTIPTVAIGGLTNSNITQLSGSGIAGVAVISAIMGQPSLTQAAKELTATLNKMVLAD